MKPAITSMAVTANIRASVSEAILWRLISFSSLDLVSYDREISLAGMQDFLRCKPRITPVTFSIFPAEHEPSLTYTTA
jgi:hypothetical protein